MLSLGCCKNKRISAVVGFLHYCIAHMNDILLIHGHAVDTCHVHVELDINQESNCRSKGRELLGLLEETGKGVLSAAVATLSW